MGWILSNFQTQDGKSISLCNGHIIKRHNAKFAWDADATRFENNIPIQDLLEVAYNGGFHKCITMKTCTETVFKTFCIEKQIGRNGQTHLEVVEGHPHDPETDYPDGVNFFVKSAYPAWAEDCCDTIYESSGFLYEDSGDDYNNTDSDDEDQQITKQEEEQENKEEQINICTDTVTDNTNANVPTLYEFP